MSGAPVRYDFEDADEADLSFSDLPFSPVVQPERFFPTGLAHPQASSPRDASGFEFSTSPAIFTVDAFLFCGRPIPYDERESRVGPLLPHSDSLGRRDRRFVTGRLLRSKSLFRVMRSSSSGTSAAACAGSSPSRRRHRALIGIAKLPVRMELSDIRRRQGRRAPASLFPAAEVGKEVVGGRSGGHWRLLRPLRCRSHLANHLLRSKSLLLPAMRSGSSVTPVTACAGSSPPRRRHGALIGITKLPVRMELSDIRRRQGRRAPAPLFPVAEGGKEVTGGRSGGRWSLLRPLRCRSHLANAMAMAKASLGCIPHA